MPSLTEIEPNQFDFGEGFNIKAVEYLSFRCYLPSRAVWLFTERTFSLSKYMNIEV